MNYFKQQITMTNPYRLCIKYSNRPIRIARLLIRKNEITPIVL